MPLVLSLTGAAFTDDPQNILKDWLDLLFAEFNPEEFNPAEFNTGADERVVFANNFFNLSEKNQVVIERMPQLIQSKQVGGKRFEIMEYFRLQVYCSTHSAKHIRYQIQNRLRELILERAHELEDDGIKHISLSEFKVLKIQALPEQGIIARSWARVVLKYEMVAA